MDIQQKSFEKLQISLNNDCERHPYAYYFYSISDVSKNRFHWLKDESFLLSEIANDLYALVTTDEAITEEIQDELFDIIDSFSANDAEIDWAKLQLSLNDFLNGHEISIWVGTFFNLCASSDDFSRAIRQEFRIDFLSDDSEEDKSRPIEETENDDFVEFLSSYTPKI
jgi:hypothetical protein